LREVSKLSDATAGEVKESQESYHSALYELAPYKRVLDVWLSEYFGNKNARQVAAYNVNAIIENKYTAIDKDDRRVIEAGIPLAASKRFFHWELEFPEVFFDESERKTDGGFDAVVGNPPYVRQEGLGDDKAAFQATYKVFNSIADLYTYFIERGHMMLRTGGRFGMITANKFMRANYGAALRTFLIDNVMIEKLIDFGDLPVFGDATTYPVVILSSKEQRNGNRIEYALLKTLNFEGLHHAIQAESNKMPESAFLGNTWSLAAGSRQAVLDKLKSKSVPLGEYVGGKIQYGIKTGFNEAFIIDKTTRDKLIAEDPKSAEVIKPFVSGEDVRKYGIDFQGRYLIWTYIGIPINQYPAIYKRLQHYRLQLEKRSDKGNHWWELRPCSYYDDFEKPKIMYPEIFLNGRFTADIEGYYCNKTIFIIPVTNMYLLSVLNSRMMNFNYELTLPKIRGGFFIPSYVFMKNVPIRRINFTTSPSERARCLDKARQ
jgi:hypothetical protein